MRWFYAAYFGGWAVFFAYALVTGLFDPDFYAGLSLVSATGFCALMAALAIQN